MKITLHPYKLRLQHVFRIAHYTRQEQETLIVTLSLGDHKGYGEAIASPYYGISAQDSMRTIEKVRDKIEAYDFQNPKDFWNFLYPYFQDNLFALCGLNNAAHDLYSQQYSQPLYKLWNLNPAHNPICNYTIGIGEIPEMIAKIKERPWPVYKIKLGTDHDLEIIQELRKHTSSHFRVDANCAWTADETIINAKKFQKLGVEFIEQPLKADNWEGMKEVFKHSVLPIIADESCIRTEDVAKCIGYFHGINIKLTKCGGLTPARRMIAQAKAANMKVMVGCMTESSVGISAIGHIAPMLDYVDMDSILLIANDPAEGVRLDNGRIVYADRSGLGIVWKG